MNDKFDKHKSESETMLKTETESMAESLATVNACSGSMDDADDVKRPLLSSPVYLIVLFIPVALTLGGLSAYFWVCSAAVLLILSIMFYDMLSDTPNGVRDLRDFNAQDTD